MIFRIPSGKHRASPFRFGVWWNRKSFAWKVKFTESCRYDLRSDDQGDTNKLCGIGYLPGHHKNSARFGWRYRTDKGSVEFLAYCYVNKQRVIKSICLCEIGKEYDLQLLISEKSYSFFIYENDTLCGSCVTGRDREQKLGYKLGVYFGGNQKAPHEIKIELKRL
jgi:hypothetical protein